MELSTLKILQSAMEMARRFQTKDQGPRTNFSQHLDIGAGNGDLIALLRNQKLVSQSSACDYTTSLMQLPDVGVHLVNLNNENLPFADASFDLITCTEVVEHLENYRELLRDAYRVAKPNGVVVISTPNILNLKSRIRFLLFGFYNLFGPLHVRESALHSAGGHITPISYFYLAHALMDAGFTGIEVDIDRSQGGSKAWLLFLYLPIRFFSYFILRRETKRFLTIDAHNAKHVSLINSIKILLGRTIILGAYKPS